MIVLSFVGLLVFGLATEDIISSEVEFDDPAVGSWEATSADMDGLQLDVVTVFPGGVALTLNSDGTFEMNINDENGTGDWSYADGSSVEINISGSGIEASGRLENNVLTLENVLDSGINLIFNKDGMSYPDSGSDTDIDSNGDTDDGADGGTVDGGNIGGGTDGIDPVNPPEIAEGILVVDSYWAGYFEISNHQGITEDIEGTYETYAHILEDSHNVYFELYSEPDRDAEDTVVNISMYVDLVGNTLYPNVGDNEHSWTFYGVQLYEEDEDDLIIEFSDGLLRFQSTYHFDDGEDSFDVYLELWPVEGMSLYDTSGTGQDDGFLDAAYASLMADDNLENLDYAEVVDRYFDGIEGTEMSTRTEHDGIEIKTFRWESADGYIEVSFDRISGTVLNVETD